MATIPRREPDEEFGQLDEESIEPVARRKGAFATRNPGNRDVSLDEEAAAIERSLRRRGRVIPMIVAGLALVGFGAAIWFAYDRGLQPDEKDELVVIKADPLPEKEKPSEEGGLDIPHQDKLLLNEVPGSATESKVEQLLPEPETPLPAVPPADESPDAPAENTQQTAKIMEEMAANEPEVPAVPADSGAEAAPKASVEGEAAQAEAEAAADKVAESTSGVTPAPAPPKPAPKAPESSAEGAAPKKAASQESSTGGQAAAKTAEPAAEKKTASAIASGDIVLQLISVGSQAGAEQSWARMQKAHGSLLGSMSFSVEKAQVNGKTYYRVLTGPFPNRATALDMCAQLKAQKQDCLVRKR